MKGQERLKTRLKTNKKKKKIFGESSGSQAENEKALYQFNLTGFIGF